eukprot:70296-Rhodomonas_salina.1
MARRHDTKQYVEDELIARLIRNLPEVSEMIEKLREIASTRDVDDVGNVDDTKQVHASAFFFCLLSCFLSPQPCFCFPGPRTLDSKPSRQHSSTKIPDCGKCSMLLQRLAARDPSRSYMLRIGTVLTRRTGLAEATSHAHRTLQPLTPAAPNGTRCERTCYARATRCPVGAMRTDLGRVCYWEQSRFRLSWKTPIRSPSPRA